jgi:hypothetical protein
MIFTSFGGGFIINPGNTGNNITLQASMERNFCKRKPKCN